MGKRATQGKRLETSLKKQEHHSKNRPLSTQVSGPGLGDPLMYITCSQVNHVLIVYRLFPLVLQYSAFFFLRLLERVRGTGTVIIVSKAMGLDLVS